MDYNYFFNTYDFQPTIGFDSREKQAQDAGVDSELCQMFGYGYYDCENPPTPPQPQPSTPKCLTFTVESLGDKENTFDMCIEVDAKEEPVIPTLEYSTDNGTTWSSYTFTEQSGEPIVLDTVGATVMFRGNNESLGTEFQSVQFVISQGTAAASGDVTSLLNGVGGDIPAPAYCYVNMFHGCTSLTQAPALPATTLADYCYNDMFNGCTSLVQAPALPAETLAEGCYNKMFDGCTSLNYVKAMFLTNIVTNYDTYTSGWLFNVAGEGTFVANVLATWPIEILKPDGSTIPDGWTVQTASE